MLRSGIITTLIRSRSFSTFYIPAFSVSNTPLSSPNWALTDRCLDATTSSTLDVLHGYAPNIFTDVLQTSVTYLNGLLIPSGMSFFISVGAIVLLSRLLYTPIHVYNIKKLILRRSMANVYCDLRRKASMEEQTNLNDRKDSKKLEEFHEIYGSYFNTSGILIPVLFNVLANGGLYSAIAGMAQHPWLFKSISMSFVLSTSPFLIDGSWILPILSSISMAFTNKWNKDPWRPLYVASTFSPAAWDRFFNLVHSLGPVALLFMSPFLPSYVHMIILCNLWVSYGINRVILSPQGKSFFEIPNYIIRQRSTSEFKPLNIEALKMHNFLELQNKRRLHKEENVQTKTLLGSTESLLELDKGPINSNLQGKSYFSRARYLFASSTYRLSIIPTYKDAAYHENTPLWSSLDGAIETITSKSLAYYGTPFWLADALQGLVVYITGVTDLSCGGVIFGSVILLRGLMMPFFILNIKRLRENFVLLKKREVLQKEIDKESGNNDSRNSEEKSATTKMKEFNEKHSLPAGPIAGTYLLGRSAIVPLLTVSLPYIAWRASLLDLAFRPWDYKSLCVSNNFTGGLLSSTDLVFTGLALGTFVTHHLFTVERAPESMDSSAYLKQDRIASKLFGTTLNERQLRFAIFFAISNFFMTWIASRPCVIAIPMLASNLFSIGQGLLVRSEKVCHYFDLPLYHTHPESDYAKFISSLEDKRNIESLLLTDDYKTKNLDIQYFLNKLKETEDVAKSSVFIDLNWTQFTNKDNIEFTSKNTKDTMNRPTLRMEGFNEILRKKRLSLL